MSFKQPKLPYAENALEPWLFEHQVSVHYHKHTTKYFDTTNKLIKGTVFEKKTNLTDLINKNTLVEADSTLFNNACQAWNHIFYFSGMCPADKSNKPSDALMKSINEDFGSFDEFKKKFIETAAGVFGSGWAWLVHKDNKLTIKTTPNGGNPLTTDRMIPLMCIDVWEHAYYIQYEYDRKAYLNAIWNVISWDTISQRYADLNK